MNLRTIKEADLKNKKVIMRVDFNVPLKNGEVKDDTRIRAALPSIEYILNQSGSSLIVMSHLGRPKGTKNLDYSMAPVGKRFEELLGKKVKIAKDVIGAEVEKDVSSLKPGEVLLLENVRFYPDEEENNPDFAKKLASYADVYVNDAFGTAHRAHASTEGIAHFLPSYAGFLIEKEIHFLAPLIENPEKPFVSIIGGAKVSSKITVLESLLRTSSTVVIGGGMSYTFLKVLGYKIGNSLVEDEFLKTAESFLEKAKKQNVNVILPSDHVCAKNFSEDAEPVKIDDINIPDGLIGMDIGPKTVNSIINCLKAAKSVVWNGPMGVFEFDNFSKGTESVAKALASINAVTVVGGGDSVSAINKFGLSSKISHVSTGGGASLEFLEGKTLPGIQILTK